MSATGAPHLHRDLRGRYHECRAAVSCLRRRPSSRRCHLQDRVRGPRRPAGKPGSNQQSPPGDPGAGWADPTDPMGRGKMAHPRSVRWGRAAHEGAHSGHRPPFRCGTKPASVGLVVEPTRRTAAGSAAVAPAGTWDEGMFTGCPPVAGGPWIALMRKLFRIAGTVTRHSVCFLVWGPSTTDRQMQASSCNQAPNETRVGGDVRENRARCYARPAHKGEYVEVKARKASCHALLPLDRHDPGQGNRQRSYRYVDGMHNRGAGLSGGSGAGSGVMVTPDGGHGGEICEAWTHVDSRQIGGLKGGYGRLRSTRVA